VFTGLIDAVGRVQSAERREGNIELTIAAPYDDLQPGESVSVSGACLTVVEVRSGAFRVQAVATTQDRTRFAALKAGDQVNLERALKSGDRLGGHLVQGHVDGVANVVRVVAANRQRLLDLRVAREIAGATVLHGSITVDGVSLTVNALPKPGVIQISLIPYTLEHTTLGQVKKGDRVHVEGDVIGKYVKEQLGGKGRKKAVRGGKGQAKSQKRRGE
jgi:riboflavin synthase